MPPGQRFNSDVQELHLGCSKERRVIGLAVALAAVDKHRLKQGLCAVPCPVQALGKSGFAFAVQAPRLVHDFREVILFHTVLALLCGSAPV